MKPFNLYFSTKIIFGRKRILDLGSILPAKAIRILIVTDKNIATRTQALESVRSHLEDRQVFLFQDVKENPDFSNVEDGGQIARDVGAELIVGVGGGSSMDAAKGIALLAANRNGLHDYLRGEPLLNPSLQIICIPTTSGSGSEATPYAVFTDLEDQTKIGYANPGLFSIVSVVDPELTYSMPEAVVVSTGLDALTQVLESYLSTESFIMNDILALHVMEEWLKNNFHKTMGKS